MNAITPENAQVRRDICADCKNPCEAYAGQHIDFDHPCSVCPIGRWGRIAPHGACDEQPPLPPLLTRAANLLSASAQEGKAIAQGVAPITEEEAQSRFAICRTNRCKQFRSQDDTCAACGCFLKSKTAWRSASCPRGHW